MPPIDPTGTWETRREEGGDVPPGYVRVWVRYWDAGWHDECYLEVKGGGVHHSDYDCDYGERDEDRDWDPDYDGD